MSTSLTIRNLDAKVKHKLRLIAAKHHTSMEAEARAIISRAVNETDEFTPPATSEELRARLMAVRGLWADRSAGKSTDEVMKELRGDD
ncbi:MAG: FitA-like ribbon-helix-helix domain-containing protein [Verrucomicrobiales bacterium]